jgi:hypothetical protein
MCGRHEAPLSMIIFLIIVQLKEETKKEKRIGTGVLAAVFIFVMTAVSFASEVVVYSAFSNSTITKKI